MNRCLVGIDIGLPNAFPMLRSCVAVLSGLLDVHKSEILWRYFGIHKEVILQKGLLVMALGAFRHVPSQQRSCALRVSETAP